ncbi:hypothetical protein GB927_014840 [Shinella sp. CPCC 100929]|uniref:Transposase n=1 Tax=Shinella lacus TaxID=2654216 RepID=A0ABT1R831_9HYPH|nr:hypothetical protein [Shinella lacus]MCQ4631325.1 hypothetical protein [Shinella lacus]
MSPEWMMAFDTAAGRNDKRRKTLADPLERPEWQGLDALSRLFSRLLSRRMAERRRRPMQPLKYASASINEFNGSVR